MDIPFTVTPGVPAFAAAAAALECELTLPELGQSLILTRTPGRASSMPPGENLRNFAMSGATLAIHLSIHNLAKVVEDLALPMAVIARSRWCGAQAGPISGLCEPLWPRSKRLWRAQWSALR
jgi:precorrin-4/cobalt-precorrin-4 C11-methyltransferase